MQVLVLQFVGCGNHTNQKLHLKGLGPDRKKKLKNKDIGSASPKLVILECLCINSLREIILLQYFVKCRHPFYMQ
jgi:hypothetical protein